MISILILIVVVHQAYAGFNINYYAGTGNARMYDTKEQNDFQMSVPSDYVQFGSSYYKYHRDPRQFFDALRICEAEGARLAIVNSMSEALFITSLMAKYPAAVLLDVKLGKDFVFIGFHDLFREGNFTTIDGRSLTSTGFTQWAPSQPDNAGKIENCGTLTRAGLLNDFVCDNPLPYICEISNVCT